MPRAKTKTVNQKAKTSKKKPGRKPAMKAHKVSAKQKQGRSNTAKPTAKKSGVVRKTTRKLADKKTTTKAAKLSKPAKATKVKKVGRPAKKVMGAKKKKSTKNKKAKKRKKVSGEVTLSAPETVVVEPSVKDHKLSLSE